MSALIWLKMLRRWLEPGVAVEEEVDVLRGQQERSALEIRKAEAAAWYYPTLY
jgi:hypothetical protein